MSALLAAVALALLAAGAWRDIVTRTIPDMVSLLLLAVGGLTRLLEGASDLALSAVVALVLFVLLLLAFSRGILGGGDVNLMTALAVGLSPCDSYRFVVATALAGGLLALAYLLLSHFRQSVPTITRRSLFGRILTVERWRIRRRGPLPYAVAIAAGGAFVLLQPGSY